MKYYFFSYSYQKKFGGYGQVGIANSVSTDHPFERQKQFDAISNDRHKIISFQEISKEEFDLFIQLNP